MNSLLVASFIYHTEPNERRCPSSLLSGRNVRWPRRMLVSHGEYADGTDRWTEGRTIDRYITLSARRDQRQNKENN